MHITIRNTEIIHAQFKSISHCIELWFVRTNGVILGQTNAAVTAYEIDTRLRAVYNNFYLSPGLAGRTKSSAQVCRRHTGRVRCR